MNKERIQQGFFELLRWREKHIKEPIFLGLLSCVIGVLCAICGFVLKTLIHFLQHGVKSQLIFNGVDLGFLFFPVLGILLSGLFVRYIIRDDIGHGVTKILYALSQRKSRIKPHNMWSSIIASSVTIGLGGSVGAESPIVLTGSAIGSNIGRLFRLEQKNLMLLVGCGAAGAVAGIFKAPITGLIFVIEVLMLDLTLASVLPLLIASVTGATVAYALSGTEAMFSFTTSTPFALERIPWVLLLGVLCGLASLYYTKVSFNLERWFKKISNYYIRFLIAGITLSLLIFFVPTLYGEGYDSISILINDLHANLTQGSVLNFFSDKSWVLPLFILLSILLKVFATVCTNSGGGCGGVFAPSLFIGCMVGFLFAYICDTLGFTPFLPTKNFALMGMAGVMAGIMHAPLTGTFLIAELTGSYDLFLPLLIVSISSFATIKLFLPHSIYSLRLAEKGKLLTHQKDKAVLTLMQVDHVIENDFSKIHPDMTLGNMVQIFSNSHRNIFPVVDNNGILHGIVLLDNIRNIMFRPELYERFKVSKFMVSPPAKLQSEMTMDQVMTIFDDTQAWNLPVVDAQDHYLGFISKSQIFNAYRNILISNFDGD